MTEHEHAFYRIGFIDHAPCGPPPEHTRFEVLFCACGACDVFPRSNYELVTPAYRAQFEARLTAIGMQLLP